MKKAIIAVVGVILLALIVTLTISAVKKLTALNSVDVQEEIETPIVVDYTEVEEPVVDVYEEQEEHRNTEDLHNDAAFVEQHNKFINTGAEFWEPPVDWEMPEKVYATLDPSVMRLYGSMHYTESVKLQYAMYMFFGEDLSGIRWVEEVDVAQPDGVDLYWELLCNDGRAYVIWMDYYCAFIIDTLR